MISDPVVDGGPVPAPVTTTELAARIAERRQVARTAEVDLLLLAVAWAEAHPDLDPRTGEPRPTASVSDDALAAHFVGLEPEETPDSPSWAGLPRMSEDAVTGFATAADLGRAAATSLLRDALTLVHRLPRCWRVLLAGEVDPWRARRVAVAIAGAPDDVARAVDLDASARLATIGPISLGNLIQATMIALYPDHVEAASLERLDALHVTVHGHRLGDSGLVELTAQGEYAEFDDLDRTLDTLADLLPDADDSVPAGASRGYRRARALGLLADPAAAAALLAGADPDEVTTPRRVELVVHATPEALAGTDPVVHAGIGSGRSLQAMLGDLAAAWCGRPRTHVVVRPVVDLGAVVVESGYRPSESLARQIRLRDRTCRFPHCEIAAGRCDLDHVEPHAHGGPTSSANLMALCRHHHRLKTHHGYRAEVLSPGVVRWTTPHGQSYLTSPGGTRRLHQPTSNTAPTTGTAPAASVRATNVVGSAPRPGSSA